MTPIKYLTLGIISVILVGCGAAATPAATPAPTPQAEATTPAPTVTAEPTVETDPPPEVATDPTATATVPPTAEATTDAAAEVDTAAADIPPIEIGETGMVTYQTMALSDGTTLDYAVALPADFDPAQTYPILLALPPGGQNRAMVQTGLDRYWAAKGIELGWIVLSPVAPGGILFFQGSEAMIPEFLERTATVYQPEGGKYHLAGISNGGISAFRIAFNHPELIHSLLALPGLPRNEADFQKLERLTDIPVAMFVGAQDTGWIGRMEETEAELSRLGGQVSLEIVPNEGHVIQSLDGGEELFALLEAYR